MLSHWCISIELALYLPAEIPCLIPRNLYLCIWGYNWVGWELNRTVSTVLSNIHLSLNVICIIAKANLFGILVNALSRDSCLTDCNLYVVKDRSQKKTNLIVGFKFCKLSYYLVMDVSTAFLCCSVFTQVQIMDSLNLSLSRIPFQGLPLLGNLHSVDITRRIGSLICSRLTLNVIHSGQLEAWTFFVRETSLTKSFNQTTQKAYSRRFCMESTAFSRTLWSTQEIQTCSLFKAGNVSEWCEKKTREILSVDLNLF